MTDPVKIVIRPPRKSLSVLNVGDTFVFNDLAGMKVDSDYDRLITIRSISVSGDLAFTITWCNPAAVGTVGEKQPSLHNTPYPTALLLIKQQIWQPCQAETIKP